MLLPSPELMQLHETVPICLSGQELPGDCDIRYGQFYYFFLFNTDGELTTVANISTGLSERKKNGLSLPEAFLEMVEESLQVETSLESVERAYLESRGSQSAFRQLRQKLKEMELIGSMRVASRLRSHAEQMEDPTLTRLRALSIETAAVKQQVIHQPAFDHLARRIEAFLLQNPERPEVKQLLNDYFQVALKYQYGLQDHCERLVHRWKKKAPSEQTDVIDRLSRQLTVRCQQHLDSVDQAIEKLKDSNGWEAPRLYAQKGDAQNTLRALEHAVAVPVLQPIYREWRKQAGSGQGPKQK